MGLYWSFAYSKLIAGPDKGDAMVLGLWDKILPRNNRGSPIRSPQIGSREGMAPWMKPRSYCWKSRENILEKQTPNQTYFCSLLHTTQASQFFELSFLTWHWVVISHTSAIALGRWEEQELYKSSLYTVKNLHIYIKEKCKIKICTMYTHRHGINVGILQKYFRL